jgi:hypothetical protein
VREWLVVLSPTQPKRTSELTIRDSILVLKCSCSGLDIPAESPISNTESPMRRFILASPRERGGRGES